MEKDAITQLEEKLATSMLPYEALQYVQSFVARKKKHLTPNVTSQLVFVGAKKLLEDNSPGDAGTLLLWFLEGGAGENNPFHIEVKELEGSSEDLYCDIDRVIKLIKKLDNVKSVLICEKIYLPLVKLINKNKPPKNSSLLERVTLLEDIFADVFESAKDWQLACKAVARLEDMERLAHTLSQWSEEGYAVEKPLFFSRAVFHLFADGQAQLGMKLVKECSTLIEEQQYVDEAGSPYAHLAVWHLTIILSDMVSLTARPGPDKSKIFKQLLTRYMPHVMKTDSKLAPLLHSIGEKMFGVVNDAPQNPLDILGLLGGGGGGAGKAGAPQIDMAKMMQMMQGIR